MRRVKQVFYFILFLLIFGLLHYVLPQHDMARITGTEVRRTDISSYNSIFFAQADSGSSDHINRDIRYIFADVKKTWLLGFFQREGNKVMVYRNEDTGWIWPPYFKFDSSDLQAIAASNTSTSADPKWVVITHYGWRNKYLTIFPNAIGIRPVAGPEVTVIPWFNIFFFVFLIVGFLFLRAMWMQFRERTVDPALEDMNETFDSVEEGFNERRGRFSRWLGTWRAKK